MRVLHVNDVASVGSILTRAARGRDALFQPALRRDLPAGRVGAARFAARRLADVPRLARRFRGGGFTHLHVHYATFAPLAELAGLPWSLHVHGADVLLDPHAGGLKGVLSIRGIERATRVAVSTPDLVEPVRRIRPDAVWIPNPMELPPLAPARPSGPRPRIMLLSKMDPLKGWDRQLGVVEAVVSALGPVELHHFTHGQLPDRERARLSARLEALGGVPAPRVPREVFLAGLTGFDLLIGQMEVGALGMSELEAMAAAVPVVADAAAHEAQGLVVPVIAPERAAEEAVRLWSDPEQRRAQGLAGRSYVAEVHDPARALRALELLLGQG